MRRFVISGVVALLIVSTAAAAPVPSGYTCVGNCGLFTAPDGVVTNSPFGGDYLWVSSNGGVNAGGILPTGRVAPGYETNGSTLHSPVFSAAPGDNLRFYFNYVSSDGTYSFVEYGWAALTNVDSNGVGLLFTARTNPSGPMVPGYGLPDAIAGVSHNPETVVAIPGTAFSPIGGTSGQCYGGQGAGCGHSGWVQTSYTIEEAANYRLSFGVTNWGDQAFDSAMAIDGITIENEGGTTIIGEAEVPEPSTWGLFGASLLALTLGLRRREGGV